MKEIIMSIISAFSCNNQNEIKKYKYKQKEIKKSNKNFWKNAYKRLFADCGIEELKLMNELVKNNNSFVCTDLNEIHSDYKIKSGGVEEKLYQILCEEKDAWGADVKIKVRITVFLYKKFKKQFKKYGKCRIPKN